MNQTASARVDTSDDNPVRVMLVDDSAVVRGLIRRFIDPEPGIEVVATAGNGEAAVSTLKRTEADVIVLDVEMPVMDGLTAIPLLLEVRPGVKIVMASTLTERNAAISLQALSAGATDYLAKPSSSASLGNADDFRRELISKIYALGGKSASRAPAAASASPARASVRAPAPVALRAGPLTRPKALAIGSSTGGPQALTKVLSNLRDPLGVPAFITQHMPATFTGLLAQHLTRDTGHEIVEATDGMAVVPGRFHLAPGDYHMLIEGNATAPVIRLSQGPKENFCRPAVDPMLRSLMACYGPAILTVILTGMGHDGAAACKELAEAGGTVLAQDEASSVVWGMPGAVAQAGVCREILDLNAIAPAIAKHVKG